MYARSVAIYDAIYNSMGKDYRAEADKVHDYVLRHKRTPGSTLLDVACGTGLHLSHLKRLYEVQGLDASPEMLKLARQRCPGVTFHQGDMTDFDVGEKFDVVICLFSAIGYAQTVDNLNAAVGAMAGHLKPGGVLLVEPWIDPDVYESGRPWMHVVDEPDLKVVRMNVSDKRDGLAVLDFHYLVATPDGMEYFTEKHEVGLFTHREYLDAFLKAGLETVHDREGLMMRRGMYVGIPKAS
jgi:SAM-dependent methyltransferase